ncbi:hypothetical protein [Anianabacter salinae]|uniref:hypothetical protein n=1 Tax=Anianabacter salinae TaxID=2851023 RepID=UPI00225E1C02|nr:hypothetical protein [Anianabacter salinae]MBV0911741.1 hypothetical protein [Anianabacter salinae]
MTPNRYLLFIVLAAVLAAGATIAIGTVIAGTGALPAWAASGAAVGALALALALRLAMRR